MAGHCMGNFKKPDFLKINPVNQQLKLILVGFSSSLSRRPFKINNLKQQGYTNDGKFATICPASAYVSAGSPFREFKLLNLKVKNGVLSQRH